MKYNILIFSFLVLIIGVVEVSAVTLSDSIDINVIMPNNLNDVKKAGLGFADRKGIDVTERSEKFIITSTSKDPAVIYLPVRKPDRGKNWQDAYTITHYNETGHPRSDKTTAPHLINESWYVVFKNTDWSHLEVGGVMQFWDATDIPSLYTAISDNSKISLSGGIYTMHIPFYQNKSTDDFYFGETVHLKTVAGTAVAYYRWAGNTTFCNAAIHAWNTTSGTIVTDNSIARSYIYSNPGASGNITNCNMSYLGYNAWKKYGVFLQQNSNIIITNNTYNHNYYGILLDASCNNNALTGNNASGNTHSGICLDSSCNNNALTGNNASENTYSGICLYSSCNNNILTSNNVSENTEYGILLYLSFNNTLTSNNASGNTRHGIYLYSSCNNNTLTSNNASGNTYSGICLDASCNNTLTSNNASGNTQHGVRLDASCNNTLTSNNASGNTQHGVRLYASSNNNALTGNNASGNTYSGIYLYASCNNNSLISNNVSGNTYSGIYLYSSCNNTLIGSNASGNTQYGVRLYLSSNNALTGNNVFGNIYSGIYLSNSCNNTLIGNNASGNTQHGVRLYASSNNNALTGNNASGNTYSGIYLYASCNNNILTSNNISENTEYGIYLYTSCNNTFTNNYFNNINNTYDTGYNTWNTTPTIGVNIIGGPWLGGNYWSNYMGVDQTCDGLGDTLTPYNAGITNGGDYHPLVQVSLPTLVDETKLIMFEITFGLKGINMGNYLVYAFILIGILLIILGIQIITNNI